MARRSYSSRYSRSSRRRSSGGPRRRYSGTKRRSRYTTRRRAGRAGVLAEVKYVNNIPGRANNPAEAVWTADTGVGPTLLPFFGYDNPNGGDEIAMGTLTAANGWNAEAILGQRASMSSKSMLLTHCQQGFTANRRVGLSINPRSFILRAVVTAGALCITKDIIAVNDPETQDEGLLGTAAGGNSDLRYSYLRTTFRVVIFREMEPVYRGAGSDNEKTSTNEARTWQDLFCTSSAAGSSVTDFLRTDNIGRFQIVHDSTVDLDADTPQRNLQIRVPIAKTLRYGGPTGAQIRAGHYFIIACADTAFHRIQSHAEKYIPPVCYYQHRMAFTDS